MEQFEKLAPSEAYQHWVDGTAILVDVRDPQSFHAGHASGAYHLTNETLSAFLEQTDYEQTIMVMCYHGHSSQGAAQYLINIGFESVYSINGGFEAWLREYPQAVTAL